MDAIAPAQPSRPHPRRGCLGRHPGLRDHRGPVLRLGAGPITAAVVAGVGLLAFVVRGIRLLPLAGAVFLGAALTGRLTPKWS